jgi:hypothetical protein
MDPAWASIAIGVGSSLITGAIWYGALRSWMTRREERESTLRLDVTRIEVLQSEHGRTIGNHSERIRVLENEMDLRPPPLDYART